MNLADELVHMTTRIECEDTHGNRSSGTGFIFSFASEGNTAAAAIVSNKHVIAGAALGHLWFTEMDADGGPARGKVIHVPIGNFEASWIKHPDPSIDLEVLPIGSIVAHLSQQGKRVYHRGLGWEHVAVEADLRELGAIEDILMIGYPIGLWDARNNLPIVRRGVTVTPPYVDFEGRPEFMIDCACFPGSSGSPVLLYNIGAYLPKAANSGINLGGRFKFLGVLWGGPQYTAEGEIRVVPIPTTRKKAVALSMIPSNLGFCIKAEQLRFFEDHFKRLRATELGSSTAAA